MLVVSSASWVAHVVSWGWPSWSMVSANPDAVDQVLVGSVPAILGNYWSIWPIQHELNRNAAGKPLVTPISIRTESFGLNSFSPVLNALRRGKSFRFECIEEKETPPGTAASCSDQIGFYQFQDGFPIGVIQVLGRSRSKTLTITHYELGLANPDDPADCTASDMLFHAKPVAAPPENPATYILEENSVVYLQQPTVRNEWKLKFAIGAQEQTVEVAPGTSAQLHLLRHSVRIDASTTVVIFV